MRTNFKDAFRQIYIPYLLLTFCTLFFYGGLITSHQILTHETPVLYFRIFELINEFKAVGFPPALFPTSMQMGGHAFFIYYPPVSYYIAGLLSYLTNESVLAVNLCFFLSVLLSAYSAYYGFNKLTCKLPAIIGALLYITFPYRFIEITVRGALAESWTFVWFPIIVSSGIMMIRGNVLPAFPILTISTVGLLLTHSVIGLYFMLLAALICVPMCLILLKFKPVFPAIAALLFAAGLAAFYIVPQQANWDLVLATDPDRMIATPEQAGKQSPDWSQLFFSNSEKWNSGGTYPGVIEDGMSFEIGFPILFAFFALITVCYLRRRKDGILDHNILLTYMVGGVTFLTLVFMVHSTWFLSVLPAKLSFIQFPWRCLGLLAFFISLLVALILDRLTLSKVNRYLICATIPVICAGVNPLYKTIFYYKTPPEINLGTTIEWGNLGFTALGDYLPRDFEPESGIGFLATRTSVAKGGTVEKQKRTTTSLIVSVKAETTATLSVPLVYFPVWEAHLETGELLTPFSTKGLLTYEIPPGPHAVIIKRVLAPGQKTGIIISGVTLFLFLLSWITIWYLSFYKRRDSSGAAKSRNFRFSIFVKKGPS